MNYDEIEKQLDQVVVTNGEFFKFANIGDKCVGTYIAKKENIDGFGNPQTIYVLKEGDKVWNCGFKTSNPVISGQMKDARFGQIVRFRYDERKKTKTGVEFKAINAYHSPELVDQEWITKQKRINECIANLDSAAPAIAAVRFPGDTEDGEPVDEPPFTNGGRNEVLDGVRNIAKGKGIVHPGDTEEAGDLKIEKLTGYPVTEENAAKIILALTSKA